MSDPGGKTFRFTCPECFVSLKARVGQSGVRLACPSCSASIVVPKAPESKSVAGTTDRIVDTSAAVAAGEYGVCAPGQAAVSADLVTITCPVCATRVSTERSNLGKKVRCVECGTVITVAEAPKSLGQTRRPQTIDQARVGEYGVNLTGQATAASQQVTIPFHCRLCDTLLRGTLAEVGQELTCPDCGTKTIVPPQKKAEPTAIVGAAAIAELGEYSLGQPNLGSPCDIPVVCCLCSSRLMARADQIGTKIRCPDCGTETVVAAPAERKAGAVMGVMADMAKAANYGVSDFRANTAAALVTLSEVLVRCPTCDRDFMVATRHGKRSVACAHCGTVIAIAEQKPAQAAAAPPAAAANVEKVIHIGVACPCCGTRIHATDRQVGRKLPCPDCGTAITIPPPKPDGVAEEQVVCGGEEYAVGAPPEVVAQLPILTRSLPKDPDNDPDFDFLGKADDSRGSWQLRDLSDKLGFLGHPDATGRWLGFCIGGVAVFTSLAVSVMLFAAPTVGGSRAIALFMTCGSFGFTGLACLAWASLFSVNLVAIVEDTSAGNRVVQNWPEGNWIDQIGESFYVFNSCMVSFIPISILLQNWPPARPFAVYLYVAALWLSLPLVLLSMLETGSVFAPVSGNVAASLYRCPGAWALFYLRSFGLTAAGLAMYVVFWRFICGPIAFPLLAPMATTFGMVYARWLGILGARIRDSIETAAEARRTPTA